MRNSMKLMLIGAMLFSMAAVMFAQQDDKKTPPKTSPPKVVEPEKRGISWSVSILRQTFSSDAAFSAADAAEATPVTPSSVANMRRKADLLG